MFNAPFAVVLQDTGKDPNFNYANQTALALFGMTWEDFTSCPRAFRRSHWNRRNASGFWKRLAPVVDNYSGVRIGRHGHRFLIQNALVWTLIDLPNRTPKGQAALIKDWKFL